MTKVLTPRVVAATLLNGAVEAVDYYSRNLRAAQDRLRAIHLELSDTPSHWVRVKQVALEIDRYYFLQRVIGDRCYGDVIAQWTERGWREVIGHIVNSHAAKADLLVLVPKKQRKNPRARKPKRKA